MENLPWIIEAKKHIGVKEIPGKQHNPFILNWLKRLSAWWSEDETPWCFKGNTEILTATGWKKFTDIKDDEVVYQVDDNCNLSLTKIMKRIEKDYDGDMFDIEHRSVKISCDIGHRWWGAFGKNSGNYELKSLEDITTDGVFIPPVFSSNKGLGLTMDQLWLLAGFISDGKIRYSEAKQLQAYKKPLNIEFEVSKPRKISILQNLNPKHVYKQAKVYGPLTVTPLTVFTFSYPEWFDDCFKSYKILSNNFINSLSKEEAQTFLQAYVIFDGNGRLDSHSVIYTSNKENLDNLITIAILAGYHVSVQINKYGSEFTKKTAYRLVFNPYPKHRHIKKSHITKSHFKGKLYCVQVPEGKIVVRGENLTPIVTGNCGTFVSFCFRQNNLTIPKNWMRALDWCNWGIKLHAPATGCVVVFKRDGGGHVGFVMGKSKDGMILVLGGNQSNSVNVMKFDPRRVEGYYWPSDYSLPDKLELPVLDINVDLSSNEA